MRGFAPVLPPPGRPAVKRAGVDKDRQLPEAVRASPMPVALTNEVRAFAHHARRAEARAEALAHRQNREQLRLLPHMPHRSVALSHTVFAPVRHTGQGRAAERHRRQAHPVEARTRRALSRHMPEPQAVAGPWRHEQEERPLPYRQYEAANPHPLDNAAALTTAPTLREHEAPRADFEQALEGYFFRQSRLPPTGTTAFDPRLTPVWAGLKLPG